MITLALLLAAQTTTDCYQNGAASTCTATPPPVRDPLGSMVESMQQDNRQREAINAQSEQASADRRAVAFAQVGELIAKGDCAAALRLADFYGHRDIVKATTRACPSVTENAPKK